MRVPYHHQAGWGTSLPCPEIGVPLPCSEIGIPPRRLDGVTPCWAGWGTLPKPRSVGLDWVSSPGVGKQTPVKTVASPFHRKNDVLLIIIVLIMTDTTHSVLCMFTHTRTIARIHALHTHYYTHTCTHCPPQAPLHAYMYTLFPRLLHTYTYTLSHTRTIARIHAHALPTHTIARIHAHTSLFFRN